MSSLRVTQWLRDGVLGFGFAVLVFWGFVWGWFARAKGEGVETHVGNGRHALEMYALNEAEGGGNELGFRVV